MTKMLVDEALCTRCGTCSVVCLRSIIGMADENTLPAPRHRMAGMCIRCGHCEVFCPSQALTWTYLPDEEVSASAGAGRISPEDLGVYLKQRRSVRRFRPDPVPKETIEKVLDIARYAASGGNGQPVQWVVVYDSEKVKKIAELTIEWMKAKILVDSSHPMSGYVPMLTAAWEAGRDIICHSAPHLLVAHIPEGNLIASLDAIIALTHFDVAAPAFGIGTCWAGFVAAACLEYSPLQRELNLPEGRAVAYAMMFGLPRYEVYGIPRRKPVEVTWQ